MHRFEFENNGFLTGNFLVATPNLDNDPIFARKIIYVLTHTLEGCMGVIINNLASNITLDTVIKLLGINVSANYGKHKMVHIGGPVEGECGIIVHTNDYNNKVLIKLPNSIRVSSDKEILQLIANGIGPQKSMFFLGYAGWEAGKVEEEIKNNDWLMLPFSEEFLFTEEVADLWQKALESLGITGRYFYQTVGNA